MNKYGLTPENLLASLPLALRGDDSIGALAQAISSVLAGRIEEINHLRIYPAIDQLDEPLLDILAHDFKVDWWDADYTLEEKRRTLKDSWRVHKLMGTKAAVETAISAIYPNTKVLEWFEYGGEPYHFRLDINITDDFLQSARQRRVLERLNYYKNLRSHLDDLRYFMEASVGTAHASGEVIGCLAQGMAVIETPEVGPPRSAPNLMVGGSAVGMSIEAAAVIRANATPPVSRPPAFAMCETVCQQYRVYTIIETAYAGG